MKYTRYDYRRKKNDKISFSVMLLSIVVAAMLIGTILSNMFLKDSTTGKSQGGGPSNNTQQRVDGSSGEKYPFILLQAGFYGMEDNAKSQKEGLKTVGIPFMVEEEGSYRVFAGIFFESDYESVKSKLDQQNIANSKITYEIDITEKSANLIVEIMKGHLQILNALSQSNAASVKTEEFKSWLKNETEKLDKNSNNYNLIVEYKAYINSLPEEIDESKVEEGYLYMYKIILKIGSKKVS